MLIVSHSWVYCWVYCQMFNHGQMFPIFCVEPCREIQMQAFLWEKTNVRYSWSFLSFCQEESCSKKIAHKVATDPNRFLGDRRAIQGCFETLGLPTESPEREHPSGDRFPKTSKTKNRPVHSVVALWQNRDGQVIGPVFSNRFTLEVNRWKIVGSPVSFCWDGKCQHMAWTGKATSTCWFWVLNSLRAGTLSGEICAELQAIFTYQDKCESKASPNT